MRQLRRVFVRTKSLIGLETVFVVVAVPLELKEQEIAHDMGSVPGVADADSLVRPIGQFLSLEAIVLEVVDNLEIVDASDD